MAQKKFTGEERFEWLLSFLICNFRFVHHVLGLMRKYPSKDIPTMGVRITGHGQFEMAYNPDFVEQLTSEELTYVFYHECLHKD